jgi:hypothetical protein
MPLARALAALRDLGLNLVGFLLTYAPMRLGAVQYAAVAPADRLFQLTDAYARHFLDLLPGVGITGALGWECPVDLQSGRRGALLVLFRVAVLYQIFTKGRSILKEEPGGTERAQ